MLLIALSDIHDDIGHLPAIASDVAAADVVLLAGDLTNFGGRDAAARVVNAVRAINPHVRAVWGNCDLFEVYAYLKDEGLLLDCCPEIIAGVAFWGCGGSLPCPSKTPCEYSEAVFESWLVAEAARYLPNDMPTVLVVHQPPFETTADFASVGRHVGSRAVRAAILKHGPVACLTGHIHEGKGIDTLGSTTIVNPGPFRNGGYARIQVGPRCSAELRQVPGVERKE